MLVVGLFRVCLFNVKCIEVLFRVCCGFVWCFLGAFRVGLFCVFLILQLAEVLASSSKQITKNMFRTCFKP